MSTIPQDPTPASPVTTTKPENDTGRLDGASKARVFAVLAVIVLFTEIAPMQYTIVSAALQKIAPTFPGVGANINWAIIVFGLIGAAASPLIGKMSDVWGKKRMFLVCGVLFLIGCVLDATTSNWGIFLLGRCLQATAIATAVIAYGLIRDLMPRKYVPLGLGITATGLGVSAIAGPLLGGFLVDNYSWRAIFWALAAFTLLMLPLVYFVVPESTLRVRERIDFVGALLLAGGAALILIYLDKGHDWGWSKPTTLAWVITGVVLLVLFVLVETRVAQPIMDMQLLFHPRVALVLAGALFASLQIGVVSYAIAYMSQTPDEATVTAGVQQGVLAKVQAMTGQPMPPEAVQVALDPGYTYGNGYTLLEFALRIALLGAVVTMVCGALAGVIARKVGARIPLVIALAIFVCSAAAFAVLPHTSTVFLLVNAVFSIGFGFYYAAMPILMVEAVPQEQQGISLGMLGVMQSMGVAIGLAVVTAFLHANGMTALISVGGQDQPPTPVPDIFGDRGYELGFWVCGAAAAVALVLAVIMRHGRTPATGGTAH
ncbi:MFS transporter [Nocardia asteroides]|uniref:Major facilitator superfamily transporter n=1 Tax=Nocardia asteroides NBRC 15531 TaxID=1110697 RepID=U5E768_NOCAS|nr:MFS transporter [Nocardia asteroides]TLF67424.1 MFS transporter [Nocardia asteroides NBRC 15531]UGT51087.1 MFS transporter [Nocardia asteroides]SFM35786.1 Major Facilitator Superfamily protein [Nocardia asteroides]VEG36045.1 Spectinomycin tetracycline efflux pump [Nocardia asteroides]GAD85792.1 putative major facilitator superfamily transporter [Nocardia asteroides NBRC 15531]